MSWSTATPLHMECALTERSRNTVLRKRAAESLKSQVQPLKMSDLALPKRGLRPISTSTAPVTSSKVARAAYPSYTSLTEIIPSSGSVADESGDTPRTPMRNRLVEKAARAYLLHSDAFDRRNPESTPWKQSISRFLPRMSVFNMALNPLNIFNSAFQVFRFYITGARALQPQIRATISRSVSRSMSMPIKRMSYAHDLSIL
ncbi:uncharacterized protein [Physcomitrium patens]|uniref:Uncharacterized protein n=1 Tax=Physcomitrium patens TaxID=3218 RepID=A0A7I4BWH4_PHYPA|nr:uncharacterized protein LOC112290620 isoform X2 [Physcomitrium patens]|eukprot:XP_024392987.1 uncharacterized protein LOC112290620 isoform X2 [Physcomitrella patens]